MDVIRAGLVCFAMTTGTFIAMSSAGSDQARTADPMNSYYTNTWEFKSDEDSKLLHINEDMSMQVKLFDGRIFTGTWDRENQKVCFYVENDKACFYDLLDRKPNEIWAGTHDEHSYVGNLREGREIFMTSTESR